ncbi:MAG: DUF1414 domain-containing protein [Gammaproteobacteria bacterium]|nr:DUF1414 domain-containing protein [Gammaproteobacteria bacterium]
MAVKSKYTNKQVEDLITQLLTVLDNAEAKADLSLMVLGNAATTIINNNVAPSQRTQVALSFGNALKSSIKVELH